MNTIDFNTILERNKIASNIKSFLDYFQKIKKPFQFKEVYIYMALLVPVKHFL